MGRKHTLVAFPSAEHEVMSTDPRLRILIAEVQSRCGALFAAADATPHEEVMTQRSARLTLRLMETERASMSQYRLLHALATADPLETPDDWANRAGMPGVPSPKSPPREWSGIPRLTRPGTGLEAAPVSQEPRAGASTEGEERPPTFMIPLKAPGRSFARGKPLV